MRFLKLIIAVSLMLPLLGQADVIDYLPTTGKPKPSVTELTWYGHSAFKIKTSAGKTIFIDPWITNPSNKTGKEDLAKITSADLVLISHGHFDHVGDAVDIAKRTGAKLVATFDLAQALAKYGGFPKDQKDFDTMGNFGGELSLLGDEVSIAFVPAVHSSTVTESAGNKDIHDGGSPSGFLISIKNGPVIYHTGDTDLFSDMSLISQLHKVDIMLTCIGGHFTMGPERAAEAVRRVAPNKVIPMHYGTFPALDGTPDAFRVALDKQRFKTNLQVMKIGETLKF